MATFIDIYIDEVAWREPDHPRATKGTQHPGEFVRKGSGGVSGASTAQPKTQAAPASKGQREGVPVHIAKLRIPPAWTEVKWSNDPDASLWVTGKDSKGRQQYIYNPSFAASQAQAKFDRIKELDSKYDSIMRQNEENRQSSDLRKLALADVVHLIGTMGVRPGSATDTKAEKQAYGATTLLGKHVVKEGNNVSLRFTGKKGVDLNLPVTNQDTAIMLLRRAAAAGSTGQLFPNINEKALLDYVHGFNGGGFKTKDFRTLLGTKTAMQQVAGMPVPRDQKDYKKAVAQVAKIVSQKLGNTPTIALQSYINPVAFAPWHGAHI